MCADCASRLSDGWRQFLRVLIAEHTGTCRYANTSETLDFDPEVVQLDQRLLVERDGMIVEEAVLLEIKGQGYGVAIRNWEDSEWSTPPYKREPSCRIGGARELFPGWAVANKYCMRADAYRALLAETGAVARLVFGE